MKARTSEGIVLCQVRDYLRFCGWFVYRNQQNIGSYPGISDLTAIKGGRTIWIECKAPEHIGIKGQQIKAGKLSAIQEEFMREIISRGGEYCIAHDVNDVADYLKG